MKLRIRGNSIRLRLTKSEVERLGQTGRVEDMVEFGRALPGLRYELCVAAGDDMTRATFQDNCLSISIPAGDAGNWIRSEQVAVEAKQKLDDRKFLRILVEKDFACLTPRFGEDETDAFLNPFVQDKC